jgi:hypothetical protein
MKDKEENRTFEYHWIPSRIRGGWADDGGMASVIERIDENRGTLTRKPLDTLFTRNYSVPAETGIPEGLETFSLEGYKASLEALLGNGKEGDNPFWAASELVTEMYYKTPSGHGIPGEERRDGEEWMTLEKLIECDRRMPAASDTLTDLKWAVVHAPGSEQFVLADYPLYVGNMLNPEAAETEEGAFRAPGAFFLTPLTPKTALLVFDASVYVTYVDDDKKIVLSPYDLFCVNRYMMKRSRNIAVGPSTDGVPYGLYVLNVFNKEYEEDEPETLSFLGIRNDVDIPSDDTRPYCRLLDDFREKEIKGKGIEMYSDEADDREADFIWSWIFAETGITPGENKTEDNPEKADDNG